MPFSFRYAVFSLLLASNAGLLLHAGAPPPTGPHDPLAGAHSFVMKNGMQAVLLEDHDIPSVSLYTFFRVGSRNERPGMTGVSHFIEHMMFNGTRRVPPGAFDRTMESMGGANNAYTGMDMTAYTDWFPPEALDAMLRTEADRLQGTAFEPAVLESERGVVASERRVSDDENESILAENLRATSIMAHPYHWDVIGWMSDILGWKRDDIMAYYRTYYNPGNAVLVLAGDFDRGTAEKLVRKHYEPVTAGPRPPTVTTVEPRQLGPKRVEIYREALAPLFGMVFHSPAVLDPDFPAVKVLDAILLEGDSSRLYRRLVRADETAVSVGGGADETLDPDLFQISVVPKSAECIPRIEKAIREEIDRVAKDGVTEREIRKAVNGIRYKFYSGLRTISGKADAIGRMQILLGDFRSWPAYLGRFEKVADAQVRLVAEKYLSPDAATAGAVIPKGGAR